MQRRGCVQHETATGKSIAGMQQSATRSTASHIRDGGARNDHAAPPTSLAQARWRAERVLKRTESIRAAENAVRRGSEPKCKGRLGKFEGPIPADIFLSAKA
jgi:hypothetical protein